MSTFNIKYINKWKIKQGLVCNDRNFNTLFHVRIDSIYRYCLLNPKKYFSNSVTCRQSCYLWREVTKVFKQGQYSATHSRYPHCRCTCHSKKLWFFPLSTSILVASLGQQKMQTMIAFLFQTCLSKTKATCMSHFLESTEEFLWQYKESNAQISCIIIISKWL